MASGKLRPLAVGAPRRFETLREVPTFAELGFEAANLTSTFGIFAPARVPEEKFRAAQRRNQCAGGA